MGRSLWRAVALSLLMAFSVVANAGDGWNSFKSRFMTDDGRIQDTGNNNVSHTEGQGFAMLLAVHNDDRGAFNSLWNWTRNHLSNSDNGLFYWRYDPAANPPVADKNNASDGDVLIAWALQRAGEKWRRKDYLQASDAIQKAILAHNVTRFAGYTLMLPGSQGFNKNSALILNPSYFIFPAWRDFARRSHLQEWNLLIADGLKALAKMRFARTELPVDWVTLHADGKMTPADGWPPRFSFDAIRIPLYLYWYDAKNPQLATFQNYWRNFPRDNTPAWVDAVSGVGAPYRMTGGLLAIRDLTMGDGALVTDELAADQPYYGSSLQLLAYLALNSR